MLYFIQFNTKNDGEISHVLIRNRTSHTVMRNKIETITPNNFDDDTFNVVYITDEKTYHENELIFDIRTAFYYRLADRKDGGPISVIVLTNKKVDFKHKNLNKYLVSKLFSLTDDEIEAYGNLVLDLESECIYHKLPNYTKQALLMARGIKRGEKK